MGRHSSSSAPTSSKHRSSKTIAAVVPAPPSTAKPSSKSSKRASSATAAPAAVVPAPVARSGKSHTSSRASVPGTAAAPAPAPPVAVMPPPVQHHGGRSYTTVHPHASSSNGSYPPQWGAAVPLPNGGGHARPFPQRATSFPGNARPFPQNAAPPPAQPTSAAHPSTTPVTGPSVANWNQLYTNVYKTAAVNYWRSTEGGATQPAPEVIEVLLPTNRVVTTTHHHDSGGHNGGSGAVASTCDDHRIVETHPWLQWRTEHCETAPRSWSCCKPQCIVTQRRHAPPTTPASPYERHECFPSFWIHFDPFTDAPPCCNSGCGGGGSGDTVVDADVYVFHAPTGAYAKYAGTFRSLLHDPLVRTEGLVCGPTPDACKHVFRRDQPVWVDDRLNVLSRALCGGYYLDQTVDPQPNYPSPRVSQDFYDPVRCLHFVWCDGIWFVRGSQAPHGVSMLPPPPPSPPRSRATRAPESESDAAAHDSDAAVGPPAGNTDPFATGALPGRPHNTSARSAASVPAARSAAQQKIQPVSQRTAMANTQTLIAQQQHRSGPQRSYISSTPASSAVGGRFPAGNPSRGGGGGAMAGVVRPMALRPGGLPRR